jgi:predicted nucleic acid-binding protein
MLVQAVLAGKLRPLISVPLVLEYEAVLTRSEHLAVSGYTADEVVSIVKAFCVMGEPVHLAFRLRPLLRDAGDEFLLETGFHGKAETIVTFNDKDFQPAAATLGIEIILPREAWRRVRIL